jgi:hypothetical protein
MSAEIINLRQARKQRARDLKAVEAAENRARFGRSKAERAVEELSRARAGQALDGHAVMRPDASPKASPDDASRATASDGASKSPTEPPPKTPQ